MHIRLLKYHWLMRVVVWCAAMALWMPARASSGSDAWAGPSDAAFRQAISVPMIVNVMAQDRDGFLWLGSQTGLLRWDGYKLRTYLGDVAGSGTLPDSFVLALHVDAQGRLWVGTSAGGLARYDAVHERFELPVPAAALSRPSVFAIAEDHDGALLLGTGAGLDRVDPARRTVQRHADWATAQGLPPVAVYAALVDRNATLWVGTEKGVYRRQRDGRFVSVPLAGLDAGQSVVNCMLADAQGRIWVGTRAHGAFVADPGDAQARPLYERVQSPPGRLAVTMVRSLTEAKPGEVWLGTDGEGVLRVDTVRWQIKQSRHLDNVAGSLPKNEVFALFRDRGGLVWAATDTGVSFHDALQTGITTWFGSDESAGSHPGGLSQTNVPYVLPMPDGTVWLSTGDGGIDIVEPSHGRTGGLRPVPASPLTALPDGRVLCMALSPSGREVYAGTRRGLYRITVGSLRVERLTIPGRAPTAIAWALAWQGDRLWVGGLDGLWGVQPAEHDTLRVFARDDGAGLGDQRITALLPDSDGRLWVGTRSGVVLLDPTTMRAQRPPQDAPGRIGLPGGYIASIVKDAAGRVWVAGYGSGIRVFEPSPQGPKHLRRITTAEGMPNNAVNALAIDRQGDAWASTDDGIVRIARDSFELEPLGAGEGLGVLTYWTNAAGVTADGHVLFGGSGGLTIIDPQRVVGLTHEPPPLAVTEVRLGDDAPLTTYQPGPDAPVLRLLPGRRSVLVEFAGLGYAAPLANRYQYRLRDVDSRWISTDANRRFAAYTNLPPGDHVLELRTAAAKGPWSAPLLLPLHVQPAWHETVWARAAFALLAAAALWALVHARTAYLRERKRVLQALVAERTRQLEDSQRELERIAYFDGLTGLANRRMFNDELKRMLAGSLRTQRSSALLLIDLDYFKQINDTLGHDAGDAMLVAVAQRFNAVVRETDRVARLGGDEFAILLNEVEGPDAVQRVCERLFEALAPQVMHKGSALQPSASVGAALCPRDGHSPEALYKAADVALYEAKRAGRNGWRIATAPSAAPAANAAAPIGESSAA